MKQYSFIQEANWASMAGKGLQMMQRSNAHRGALAGAAIGAGVNVVKNAMKSDDDKTKKGVIRSALGGATTGAMVGGAAGAAAGHLSRKYGEGALNYLKNKGNIINGTNAGKRAVAAMGDAAYKDGAMTDAAKKAYNDAFKANSEKISLGGRIGKRTFVDSSKKSMDDYLLK